MKFVPRLESRTGQDGARSNWAMLVVEDQRSLAEMQAAMFRQRWGCTVDVANTMQQAADLLNLERKYEVACCDLHLPDSPNGEVVDLCVSAGVPTIAVSGAFGSEIREFMLGKGVLDYVLKTNSNAYGYIADLIDRLHSNARLKALVVESDEAMRNSLALTLSRLKLKVLTAPDARGGMRAIEAHPDIRLVIIDHEIPGMSGIAMAQELRKHHGKDEMGIIGIASKEIALGAAQFLKSGANDFISKPFSFEELICRINQNLDMLDLVKENRDAAYSDFLTGLRNRRHFFKEAPKLMDNAGKPSCVAMLDIDHFKRINDTWGHDIGDIALRHVANLLHEQFHAVLLARVGGEEFAIMFPGQDALTVRPQLERLRTALAASPVIWDENELGITASIGLTMGMSVDIDAMMRDADEKLYAAKAAGRDRIVGP